MIKTARGGIVIVEVFVTQTEAERALLDEVQNRVLDQVRIAMIGEAIREPLQDAGPLFQLPQQHAAGIRGDRPAVKPGHHVPPPETVKCQILLVTLCHNKTAPSVRCKWDFNNSLTSRRAVLLINVVRNPG